MRVSDSARVLFVHVQKTGGNTIDHIFDTEVPDARRVEGRNRHSAYGRLLTAEPALASYWSCAFVRNPWARLVSWFTMISAVFTRYEQGDPVMVRKVDRIPWAWMPHRPYAHDFDAFVLEGVEAVPKVRRPQVNIITTRDGRRVDFVGRTESFVADANVLRERLGLPPVDSLPRHNATSTGHYSEWYGETTRRKVEALFARDLEEFGYTFERPAGSVRSDHVPG